MPSDTTWDDVWAEYDARTGQKPTGRVHTPWYISPVQPAPPPRARRHRLGRAPVVAALMMLVAVVLGLPFGEAGAPAVASQDHAVPARHTMVVAGLSGAAELSESPAESPPPATGQLVEATPPAATAQPMAAARAASATPARLGRQGVPNRRVAQARRHRQHLNQDHGQEHGQAWASHPAGGGADRMARAWPTQPQTS